MERKLGADVWLTARMGVALAVAALLYLALEALAVWVAIDAARSGDLRASLGGWLFAFLLPYALWIQVRDSGRVALDEIGVRPPTEDEAARLEPLIARLAGHADVPPPALRMIGSRTPNALAIARGLAERVDRRTRGRERADAGRGTIVVTTGLLDHLGSKEVEAVVAHELAHLANRDAAVLTFVAGPALFVRHLWKQDRLMTLVSYITLLWPAHVLSLLTTWAMSRYREFSADRGAALITGAPEALISALLTLHDAAPPRADLRGGLATRAFWIAPPSRPRFVLFSEHPPLHRRLKRLERIARELASN